MRKQYIGKNRTENVDWLVNVWLKDGPPVCFLQGFSGVGKTDLARDFRDLAAKRIGCEGAVIHEITDRPTPDVLESLMELSSVLAQQGMPEMEQVLFGQANPNLAYALETVLRRPVVIIIDEAQRFFHADSGKPLPQTDGILRSLGNRRNLLGRLLLLSDRNVEWSHGSEWIPKRTLHKLEPNEAIEALDTKLQESGVTIEIPLERKKDVVRALDFNPRAIEALVGALYRDSLDDIMQSDPGLWAVQDREVSRDFIRDLEHRLLERTLRHLEDVHQRRLWRLSVHRRSFKREALERVCGKDEVSALLSNLESRFLLNFYKGALALNPIVREISLSHLRDEPAEYRQAHSSAADYHMRHFTAKQIVASQSKLGESFAELRYHLVQAGREAELGVIGQRFTDHLKRDLSSVSPVPNDRDELDERIGVLTALLGNAGSKGLEYHLARCLQSRGIPGDIQQAVIHAERALGAGATEATWYLLANVKRQAEGPGAAVEVIRRAVQMLINPDSAAPLYQLGAEILAGVSKTDEAVALLKDGIKVIPPDKNLFSLYQICADLLAKAGKTDEAVAQLKDGIKVIPPDKNLFSLYQICADLLAKAGKTDEAVAQLKDGIKVIPPDKSLFSLYQICADLLAKAGKTDEAVALLKDGIKVIPPDKSLSSLYQICADLLAKAGKTDEAVALLKDGIKVIPPDKSLSSLYQILGEVHCRAGKLDDAITALREGVSRIPIQFSRYKVSDALLYLCLASGDKAKLDSVMSATGSEQLGRQSAALGLVLQCLIPGDWRAAADTANAARREFPRYFALASMETFSLLAAGDAEAGWQSLASFPNLTFGIGEPHGWLTVFIHLRRSARTEAAAAMAVYLGRPVDESRELNESFLLRLWDQQEVAPESSRLCFYFPIIPASLTGLSHTVRRVQFGKPVLPPSSATPLAGTNITPPPTPATTPTTEIYVSYSWGEDATETGRQREEIVDRLCAAVTASGRAVGRDKDRMRGGDSIERFAHEISRAKRIIAVISEKSLQSEFCMAHELFRAFRRCDYQRTEFQEKVIALVMDDAKPYLKDHLAIVALAKNWQERLEKLRTELQSLDPTRKSPNLWIFVDMMEDMCPRLPDMLGAFKDIVMKRGFDEITKDGFQEVIKLLPSSLT